jgi:transcriptional regulator with XRE-family HTH domain
MREMLIQYRGKRSQKEMAEKYGVSQQLWSFWELGKSTPKPHIMKKIALDSKKPMEKIFSDAFYPPPG